MNRLFKRAVEVTLFRPKGFFGTPDVNAIVIRDLRVQFQIEKHLGSEPNTCNVTITNPNESTRAEVQEKPLHVGIDAGYDDRPHRLFSGDLRWAEVARESVSWDVKMQLGDGERAYRHARVSRSYRGGITTRDAITECARAMGLVVPADAQALAAFQSVFQSGLTLQGPASREMTRILARHDLDWSIQDGKLQILAPDATRRSNEALIISQDAGMIGSPEYGAPSEKGKPPTLTVRTLLYPQITPGDKIQLITRTRTINGFFRVERVTHTGDTHGGDWQTSIECRDIRPEVAP